MRRSSIFWALFALLSVSPALAQTSGAASAEDERLAKQYYKLGEELYNRSDYDGALTQFELSFKYSGKVALKHNMGRCLEFLGRLPEAIAAYEEFLGSNPSSASVVRARIANLKARLAQQQQTEKARDGAAAAGVKAPDGAAKGPARAAGAASGSGGATKALAPGGTGSAPQQKAVAASSGDAAARAGAGAGAGVTAAALRMAPERAETPARPLRTTGWILASAGGAAMITGMVLGAVAAGKAKTLEDAASAGKPWTEVSGTQQTGERLQTGQIISLVIGGVLLAGGATTLVIDYLRPPPHAATAPNRGPDPRRTWLSPAPVQGGAVVTGGIEF